MRSADTASRLRPKSCHMVLGTLDAGVVLYCECYITIYAVRRGVTYIPNVQVAPCNVVIRRSV
jgi:hypothetical protein